MTYYRIWEEYGFLYIIYLYIFILYFRYKIFVCFKYTYFLGITYSIIYKYWSLVLDNDVI